MTLLGATGRGEPHGPHPSAKPLLVGKPKEALEMSSMLGKLQENYLIIGCWIISFFKSPLRASLIRSLCRCLPPCQY